MLRDMHLALRLTTSHLKSRKWVKNSFKFRVWGVPFTRATLLTGKRDCSLVCLYRLFSTTCMTKGCQTEPSPLLII